jgi:hypothetical protein
MSTYVYSKHRIFPLFIVPFQPVGSTVVGFVLVFLNSMVAMILVVLLAIKLGEYPYINGVKKLMQ